MWHVTGCLVGVNYLIVIKEPGSPLLKKVVDLLVLIYIYMIRIGINETSSLRTSYVERKMFFMVVLFRLFLQHGLLHNIKTNHINEPTGKSCQTATEKGNAVCCC